MELTIEKAKFHQISLKQVSEALKKGLSKNYIEVDVSIDRKSTRLNSSHQ